MQQRLKQMLYVLRIAFDRASEFGDGGGVGGH